MMLGLVRDEEPRLDRVWCPRPTGVGYQMLEPHVTRARARLCQRLDGQCAQGLGCISVDWRSGES
jgi:hypothetical protein